MKRLISVSFLCAVCVSGSFAQEPDAHTESFRLSESSETTEPFESSDVLDALETDNVLEADFSQYLEEYVAKRTEHYALLQGQTRWDATHRPGSVPEGDGIGQTLRYRFSRELKSGTTWSTGFVVDKDATESWPDGSTQSLYFGIERSQGWLSQLQVGNYRLNLGCGLICNQAFSLGKNIMMHDFMSRRRELSSCTSANHSNMMQGAAMRVRAGRHAEVMAFVSTQRPDTTWIWNSGASVRTVGSWWRVGANLMYTHRQHDLHRPNRIDNQNAFRGHELTQTSLDYDLRLLGFHLKGETATDIGGGWATVNALQTGLIPGVDAMLMVRHYSNRYRQLLGSSIAETSAMQGETGITLSASTELPGSLTLSVMGDWWNFSKPQYLIYQPSQGYELSAALAYSNPHNQAVWRTASLTLRTKCKYRNNTATAARRDIIPVYTHSATLVSEWQFPCGLSTKSQLRFRSVSSDLGILASQSVSWTSPAQTLKTSLQLTRFDADTYASRVFVSERNLSYTYLMPSLYGHGWRTSATLSLRPFRHRPYNPLRGLILESKLVVTDSRTDLWANVKVNL